MELEQLHKVNRHSSQKSKSRYDTFFDCDDVRTSWIVIISPVSAVDAALPASLTWTPEFALKIPRLVESPRPTQ